MPLLLHTMNASINSKHGLKGSLPGLDGRRVLIRSDHAALNTLLQSAGAIVMKQGVECCRVLSAAWSLRISTQHPAAIRWRYRHEASAGSSNG